MKVSRWLLVLGLVALCVSLAVAIGEEPAIPRANIRNDEGGAVLITGSVAYTNPFFSAGVSEPLVILEDQTGFIQRNKGFVLSKASQALGQITSDFYTSPFTYSLALPIEPQGEVNDINGDGLPDVMVFAIAYWSNTWGDAFLEERDLYGGGWSTAYASTLISGDAVTQGEYIGGKVLVYAVRDGAVFPNGFGADGKLFTADDPLVSLPQGYTLVDMSQTVFTFDRSRLLVVDLLEGEQASADDFSSLSYTASFDAMVEKFRRQYAFTEYKGIDWDALKAEFRPRIERAEATRDATLFSTTLLEFAWRIPDGHVSVSFTSATYNAFINATDGGLGMAIRELDDGRVIVNYLTENGPAVVGGVQMRAEIFAINGKPIAQVIDEAVAWSAPFSTPHFERLQKLRYAVRFPLGTVVEVMFKNPNEAEARTATMRVSAERESFNFSSFNRDRSPYLLPVEYRALADGYVYVQITSFFDDERLTISLWERMLRNAIEEGAPGIILDMRNNGGGSGYLADQMAAYFFDETYPLGNSGRYDERLDDFYFDPNRDERFILPPDNLRWRGNVVVLVGPNCLSACEFFSWNMTRGNRADIVGHYPTGGLGGSVERFFMPDNITVQMTVGRAVDAEGNIHIEGIGVVPTVRVPVTEETLFYSGDVVLDYALDYLKSKR